MNILGIGCHPDDLEIACGGTLAKYAKEGHNVFMCHTANGNMGHKVIMPDELKAIRDKEAREAAKVLGARDSFLIDVDDVYIEGADRTARNKLVEVVRQCKADVIITHNPHDYMRDHEQTNRLAEDASFAVTLPHLLTGAAPCMDNFPPVFYMDTLAGIGFVPTEYVDISDYIEQKLRAVACHESQVKWMAEHDHIDFIDFVRTCNKYRGLQCSVPYAEGFRQFAGWPRFRTRRMLP
jgi:LmbE family N-acetylglucosaminyl deacetylase